MRFYLQRHQFYCGIDLHAKKMFLCVLDGQGSIVLHRNIRTDPDSLRRSLQPFREDLVIGVECMFSWYWLADWCREEKIPFVLGHALYMKAIHGGKAKNDKLDSEKIARLLRGGTFTLALCVSQGNARHSRPAATTNVPGAPSGRTARSRAEYFHAIQHSRHQRVGP